MSGDESDSGAKPTVNALLALALQASPPPSTPPPFVLPPFQAITVETYNLCITPSAALAALPYQPEVAFAQLKRELEHDRVQAVAHEAVWRLDGNGGSERLVVVDRWVWWRDMPKIESDFWQTGFIELVISDPGTFKYRGSVRFYGVRFWPESDGLILPRQLPIAERATEEADERGPLSKSEAERFARAMLAGWPQCTEADAHRKATLFFPEHKVPRDWFLRIFRAIRGPKKPGKAAKTG